MPSTLRWLRLPSARPSAEDEEELGDMLLVGRSVAGWAVAAGIEMVVGGGCVVDVWGVGENSFKASKSLMTDCIIWYSFF